jgi:hypothetical protein
MSEIAETLVLETSIQAAHDEDAIRLKSYRIWQQEGCPFGDELRHWEQAKMQVQANSEAEYQRCFVS